MSFWASVLVHREEMGACTTTKVNEIFGYLECYTEGVNKGVSEMINILEFFKLFSEFLSVIFWAGVA